MRTGVRRLSLLLILVLALATASSPQASDAPIRILFIGNSYTYVNNLPAMLSRLAESSRPVRMLHGEFAGVGGGTLMSHWRGGRAVEMIRGGAWDYVVLQEQSMLAGSRVNGRPIMGDPETSGFYEAARLFDAEIKKSGARTVFYLTWARKTRPEMQARLNDAYVRIARELNALLVPAGPAWQRARQQHPGIELYVEDGSHPSSAGTFLAAAVFYATLFGDKPDSGLKEFRGPAWDGAVQGFVATKSVPIAKFDRRLIKQLESVAWETASKFQHVPAAPTKPASLEMPTLPAERAVIDAAELQGRWVGELRLYAEEQGMSPASFELELNPEGTLAGVATIRFKSAERQPVKAALQNAEVSGDVLTFRMQDAQHFRGVIEFRAVRTSTGLVGTAELREPNTGALFAGSWTAKRH